MTILPRILIVDDQYGGSSNGKNDDRRNFCFRRGIQDVTGDIAPEQLAEPLCNAFFCKGQREANGLIENDVELALDCVRSGFTDYPRWALILLDLSFDTAPNRTEASSAAKAMAGADLFGVQILSVLRNDALLSRIPVVVLSSVPRERVEKSIAIHARDFVSKHALNRETLADMLFRYGLLEDDVMVGHSVALLETLQNARQLAVTETNKVLITGERGTGKEYLAQAFHRWSPRRDHPFIPQNCGALPPQLMESTLFGHIRGAFTGATSDKKGVFETADGGSVFLDEIGELPPEAHVKLHRIIEYGLFLPVGSTTEKKVDVCVIAATNRNLREEARENNFRKDLLDRLGLDTHQIVLPPLRERKEDIPLLSAHFLRLFEKAGNQENRNISNEALEALQKYDWPGNIRELKNMIEAAARSSGLRIITPNHLRFPSAPRSRPEPQSSCGRESASPPVDFPGLIRNASVGDLSSLANEDLSGLLPEAAVLLAHILKAALVATSRITREKPSGEISYHPAMKLATGNWNLAASPAADLVKRIRNLCQETKELFEADPVLREAYKRCKRSRSGYGAADL